MLRRLIILAFLFLLRPAGAWATHIVGGEIYYDCLGNNNYQITLKVYRDCINGIPPFDDPGSIGIFDPVTHFLIMNVVVTNPIIIPISSTISVPCYAPSPGTVCEEEATYTAIVNLPPNINGYQLVYQRCCRNNTIVNLVNPGSQGTTIATTIPSMNLAVCNSSARFNYYPPIYLCQGIPLIFNHSATDPDGDSLAYELCSPLDGASTLNPMPQPPDPPPYFPVTYSSPYNSNNQMAASPALTVNPYSGIMTGTPTMMGTWVVGVCCKEYRNGVLINVSLRDFQFNVVMCSPIPVTGEISSNISTQWLNCTGLTINFTQSSTNASNYFWNFGDPTTLGDTSGLPSPTYTYPANGTYTITLIANPGAICADTDTVHLTITEPPTVSFPPPPPECVIGNSFDFQATGTFGPNATFSWNFGPNATPSTSTSVAPQQIVYDTSGTFAVTVTVTDQGCSDTYTDYVLVYPVPKASFSAGLVSGCVPLTVQFDNNSVTGTPATYVWYFGDGDTSHLEEPSHTYTTPGVYDVMLIIETFAGCVGIDTFFMPGMVTVHPLPTAGFTVSEDSVSIFDPFITVFDQSLNSDSCVMDFGDGYITTDCNATHTYWNYGTFYITQTVYNGDGCWDTARIAIEIIPEHRFFIPNTFTPNGDGLNDIFMPAVFGVEEYRFLIFDRWGNMLYDTQDTFSGWDGRFKGNKCQEDVYVWKIVFKDVTTSSTKTIFGHVNLVR